MKQRLNVSINPDLVEEARLLMKARKFDSLSEFLESLIRDEWEARGKTTAEATHAPTAVISPTEGNRLNEGQDAKPPTRQGESDYKIKNPRKNK